MLNASEHMLKSHERLGGAQGIIPDTWGFSSGDLGQWSCRAQPCNRFQNGSSVSSSRPGSWLRLSLVQLGVLRSQHCPWSPALFHLSHQCIEWKKQTFGKHDPRNGKLRGISGYNWDFTSTVVHSLRRKFNTWLVVKQPLWKIWKSVGMMPFPIYGKS